MNKLKFRKHSSATPDEAPKEPPCETEKSFATYSAQHEGIPLNAKAEPHVKQNGHGGCKPMPLYSSVPLFAQGVPAHAQGIPPNVYGQNPPNFYAQNPPNVYAQNPPNVYAQNPPNVYPQNRPVLPPYPCPCCPSPYREDLWDLQFCRWWGWNWIRKRNEMMNQKKDAKQGSAPIMKTDEGKDGKQKGPKFFRWCHKLQNRRHKRHLKEKEKEQLQQLYDTPCSSVMLNDCTCQANEWECRSVNLKGQYRCSSRQTSLCTVVVQNKSRRQRRKENVRKYQSWVCEKSDSSTSEECPCVCTCSQYPSSSEESVQYLAMRMAHVKSDSEDNICTCFPNRDAHCCCCKKNNQRVLKLVKQPPRKDRQVKCQCCLQPKLVPAKSAPICCPQKMPRLVRKEPEACQNVKKHRKRVKQPSCTCLVARECPPKKRRKTKKVLCICCCCQCCCCKQDKKVEDETSKETRPQTKKIIGGTILPQQKLNLWECFTSPLSGKMYNLNPDLTFVKDVPPQSNFPTLLDVDDKVFDFDVNKYNDNEHQLLLSAVYEAITSSRSKNGLPLRKSTFTSTVKSRSTWSSSDRCGKEVKTNERGKTEGVQTSDVGIHGDTLQRESNKFRYLKNGKYGPIRLRSLEESKESTWNFLPRSETMMAPERVENMFIPSNDFRNRKIFDGKIDAQCSSEEHSTPNKETDSSGPLKISSSSSEMNSSKWMVPSHRKFLTTTDFNIVQSAPKNALYNVLFPPEEPSVNLRTHVMMYPMVIKDDDNGKEKKPAKTPCRNMDCSCPDPGECKKVLNNGMCCAGPGKSGPARSDMKPHVSYILPKPPASKTKPNADAPFGYPVKAHAVYSAMPKASILPPDLFDYKAVQTESKPLQEPQDAGLEEEEQEMPTESSQLLNVNSKILDEVPRHRSSSVPQSVHSLFHATSTPLPQASSAISRGSEGILKSIYRQGEEQSPSFYIPFTNPRDSSEDSEHTLVEGVRAKESRSRSFIVRNLGAHDLTQGIVPTPDHSVYSPKKSSSPKAPGLFTPVHLLQPRPSTAVYYSEAELDDRSPSFFIPVNESSHQPDTDNVSQGHDPSDILWTDIQESQSHSVIVRNKATLDIQLEFGSLYDHDAPTQTENAVTSASQYSQRDSEAEERDPYAPGPSLANQQRDRTVFMRPEERYYGKDSRAPKIIYAYIRDTDRSSQDLVTAPKRVRKGREAPFDMLCKPVGPENDAENQSGYGIAKSQSISRPEKRMGEYKKDHN